MYFTRGIPVIYYGAEQGFIGTGGDKASRQDMMASEVEYYNETDMLGTEQTSADSNFVTDHSLYLNWREYSRLLREHSALRNGVQHIRESNIENIYAVSRFDEATSEEYLVIFNFNSDREKNAVVPALAASYDGIFGHEGSIAAVDGDITVSVPATSLVILKATGIADLAAPVISNIEGPADGSVVTSLQTFKVTVDGADSRDIPTYTVKLQLSEDSGVSWTDIATDKTYPYQLNFNTKTVTDGTSVDVRIEATNLAGDTTTSSVSTLNVDNRTPEVTIDYEGFDTGKRVAVTYSNGSTQTYAAEAAIELTWDMTSDALLTFFTPGNNGAITADQPIWITRADVLTNSVEVEGVLESSLFINVAGEIAGIKPFVVPTMTQAEPW